ncbi:MAG TPA: 1-deoxy-D-xylulose-5-phosphate reductoisomerase [Acidothermaceae bacterium]|nr:1-deoxy-D-xylulose-5-phosphate reductoisomerase [Acidothermaceae bacterium]
MSQRRDVVILGSTGSIGTQALDVIRRNPALFRVVGLGSGGDRLDLLADQAVEFNVEVIGIARGSASDLEAALKAAAARAGVALTSPKLLIGADAAASVASWPMSDDSPTGGTVLNGMTGSIGLAPTLAALGAGYSLALANKESLIVGGALVKAAAKPGQIVPVDSEHSALAQCLRGGRAAEVRRLILTASGGPFRGRSAADLATVTPEQALAHPTWRMGPVVTINSATLVNKGLELIEAHLLFDLPLTAIDVVVHPQSVVHSMVEFTDGSTLAQCSPPDMRLPIAMALAWPQRVPHAVPACDWTTAQSWTFEPLDDTAFPAVALARQVGTAGGVAPAIYNAANEEAVAAFLGGDLAFTDIVDTVSRVLDESAEEGTGNLVQLSDVLRAESLARGRARALIYGTGISAPAIQVAGRTTGELAP